MNDDYELKTHVVEDEETSGADVLVYAVIGFIFFIFVLFAAFAGHI